MNVGLRENIEIPHHIVQRIVQTANGNLRKALLILEAMKVQQYLSVI